MAEEALKRSRSSRFGLLLLLIAFVVGIYLGVEFAEEIKGLRNAVAEPAEDSPLSPFSVKVERRRTPDGAYSVWLVGAHGESRIERQVGADLHTIGRAEPRASQ